MAINLFMIFILCSCQSSGDTKNHQQQETTQINEINQQKDTVKINKWKTDSLGCKHIRTPELFNKIFIENKLSSKKSTQFLLLFGKPNKVEKFNDRLVFIYYYNSLCYDNKIKTNSDKSSIRISFNFQGNYLDKDTRIE